MQPRERLRDPPQRRQQTRRVSDFVSHERASHGEPPVRGLVQRSAVGDAQLARPLEHELRVRPARDPSSDRLEQRRKERRWEIAKRVDDRVRVRRLENLRDERVVVLGASQTQRHQKRFSRVALS